MDTLGSLLTPPAATVSRPDRVFPTLTPAQIARVARHGRRRAMTSGEVLVEVGQRPVPFFVVSSGELQVLRPSGGTEALFVALGGGAYPMTIAKDSIGGHAAQQERGYRSKWRFVAAREGSL